MHRFSARIAVFSLVIGMGQWMAGCGGGGGGAASQAQAGQVSTVVPLQGSVTQMTASSLRIKAGASVDYPISIYAPPATASRRGTTP